MLIETFTCIVNQLIAGQELIIADVSPDWAGQITGSVESQGNRTEMFLRFLPLSLDSSV